MHSRTILAALAALALASPVHGMSKKSLVTVRFHTETNAADGDTFAMPLNLHYQQRATHINRVPAFSEHQVAAIQPFPAGDGTWGCLFKLDAQGRIRLETLSSESRGTALVIFVGTKSGQHQVVDMIIDRQVSDGMINIPRGLTDLEVMALRKQFKPLDDGKSKTPEKQDDVKDWKIDRDRAARNSKPAPKPQPPSKGRAASEPDLPRIAD